MGEGDGMTGVTGEHGRGRLRKAAGTVAVAVLTMSLVAGFAGVGGSPVAAAALPRATGTSHFNFVAMSPTPSGNGYWLAASGGKVEAFGDAVAHGDLSGTVLSAPIIGMAPTATGNGYWLLGRDGGVFSFGDASFFGSTGNIVLNKPVVGITPTSDGKGYWFVAADGGVFTFGDAVFAGSTGSLTLNQPVVGMASSG